MTSTTDVNTSDSQSKHSCVTNEQRLLFSSLVEPHPLMSHQTEIILVEKKKKEQNTNSTLELVSGIANVSQLRFTSVKPRNCVTSELCFSITTKALNSPRTVHTVHLVFFSITFTTKNIIIINCKCPHKLLKF